MKEFKITDVGPSTEETVKRQLSEIVYCEDCKFYTVYGNCGHPNNRRSAIDKKSHIHPAKKVWIGFIDSASKLNKNNDCGLFQKGKKLWP